MKTFLLEDIGRESVILEIKSHLKKNGLLVYPTDTLYGLGCDFFSIEAQKKIDLIKGRSTSPYSVIAANERMFGDLTAINKKNLFFFKKLMPGRTTIITKLSKKIDNKFVKGRNTIGIRVPGITQIVELVKRTNIPLITTSINRKGEKPLNSFSKIESFISEFGNNKDFIMIDYGKSPYSPGSTIIDISKEKPFIIRPGEDSELVNQIISEYLNRKQL